MRLLLKIIFGICILSSCSDSSKRKKNSADKSVTTKIIGLRKFGFFEKFSALDDKKLFDTLHKIRIAEYSKIFEHYYDPGMDLEDSQILSLDRDRSVYGDSEDDVCRGNNRYLSLLTAFSKASNGRFLPIEINEKWATDTGPITVSFIENKDQVEFLPEYNDDWLSEKAFDIINQQMIKKGNEKFYMFLNKDGRGLGQYFLFIRLRNTQKDSIQNTFGWKFSN